MGWYYMLEGHEHGPLSKRDLQKLINQRRIGPQTLVRKENGEEWQSLASMVASQDKREVVGSTTPPQVSSEDREGDAQEIPVPPGKPVTAVTDGAVPPVDSRLREKSEAGRSKLPFGFAGRGGEYFKIWIVNIVLSILTIGIYSAWAKVRRKQYFYGNTRVGDDTFHYLADPVKILKGRIIAVTGFILITLVNNLYPAIGNILVLLVFLPLLPWFVVRSLTFNARNSALRNIRFNFHGTYWEAFKLFVLWPILVPLTFGLIVPYLVFLQKKFIVENTSYGTTRFTFAATSKEYYGIFLSLLPPFLFCVAGAIGLGFVFELASVLVFVLFYLYAMAFWGVRAGNLLFNSTGLAGHGLRSVMEVKDFLYILVTNTIGTVATFGLYYPVAQVRTHRYKMSMLAFLSAGGLDRFVADEQEQVSALGDEVSDFMDFDIGL